VAGPSPSDPAEAHYRQGNSFLAQAKFADAVTAYGAALSLRPEHVDALVNRATALSELGRHDEALTDSDQALVLAPDDPEIWYNRGNTLQALRRPDQAMTSYDRALALQPDFTDALNNRGHVLLILQHFNEALTSFSRALTLEPDHIDALINRGSALWELKRYDEALAAFDRALGLEPGHAEALYNRGNVLQQLKRHDEALASYERAMAANPDHKYALGGAAECVLRLCDWKRRDDYGRQIAERLASGTAIIPPLTLMSYSDDPALQLQCARAYVRDRLPEAFEPLSKRRGPRGDKIKLAYLSADFRNHPVGYLTAPLFEGHDRARFDVTGISFGPDDGSPIRDRVVRAFDRFHDVRALDDEGAANLIRDLGVDIAVDLMGHTQDSRTGILARRPAPIQVSYLGFSATMGAGFIDYILGDHIVTPADRQSAFAEQIVQLPDSFWIHHGQPIAERTPSRAEEGLPAEGFVFCCFNAAAKIAPGMFDIWMSLLASAPASVLWLQGAGASANGRLQSEARSRGIDPARLVFSRWTERREDHLARQRLADLFLDTLPYNAHATASDALWAGLPVVTCRGESFGGRVAASLLSAAGLPELITDNVSDYQDLALSLVRNPASLTAIRSKLAIQRGACPLFDTRRSVRHIEAAYLTMCEAARRGMEPRGFSVDPLPG